ncbi:hypothetical protein OSJ77_03740 [Phyllobacterium sp. 0TCS1.6C]|uniref:hypothetical protein n=1 Tax=unclassified Phyllobacterium TaxID=2638441 RepID=UPI002264ED80|nr:MULTISPECIES: hypothetical protein [unclassified Phyllobacterium]MCX8279287.1 hypothetical protein [Phyllobacterium sp. 0TCS1.6C]MCX8294071.1 hypothetical protein [Phyllobacterium sp. 0TCS1.6A]
MGFPFRQFNLVLLIEYSAQTGICYIQTGIFCASLDTFRICLHGDAETEACANPEEVGEGTYQGLRGTMLVPPMRVRRTFSCEAYLRVNDGWRAMPATHCLSDPVWDHIAIVARTESATRQDFPMLTRSSIDSVTSAAARFSLSRSIRRVPGIGTMSSSCPFNQN